METDRYSYRVEVKGWRSVDVAEKFVRGEFPDAVFSLWHLRTEAVGGYTRGGYLRRIRSLVSEFSSTRRVDEQIDREGKMRVWIIPTW